MENYQSARIAELEAKIKEYEEREASCCPEDFGFDEVINQLQANQDALVEFVKNAQYCDENGVMPNGYSVAYEAEQLIARIKAGQS